MRKTVCLVLLGISIVVAATSLGVTLTRFLGLRAYSPKGTGLAAVAPASPGVPAAAPEEWNNLFAPGDGMKLASRLPTVDAKTGSLATRSNFILVGTIVSSTRSASRAVLWADGMKEPKAFREKEEIEPGAFLASVERDKAWITRGNAREKLEILPVGGHGRPTATGARPVPPPVAAAAPPPAIPTDPSTPPNVAPAAQPSPGGTQRMAPNRQSPDDEEPENLSSRAKRRRAQGLRR